MSLRVKLLGGLIISTVIVLLPFWFIAERYITDSTASDYQNRAATLLHIFQAVVNEPPGTDLKNIQKQADLLKQADPNVRNIHFYVKRKDRVIIAVSTNHGIIGRQSDEGDAMPFKTGKRQVINLPGGLIEIHEPLKVDGRVVAVVGAYFNSPYRIRLWRQILFVFAGLISMLIIAYLILDRAIIAPIRKLESATVSVAHGEFPTRINTTRRDEFGSLVAGFNEMLTALQVQDRENRTLHQQLRDSFDKVQLEANTDTLTQLHNRRYLEKQLKAAVDKAGSSKQRLACVFCDLDSFKNYNDVYGHQKGDAALRSVGTIIKACLRESDVAARYGGEEFALILPDTDIDGARAVADRIRRATADFAGEQRPGHPRLTISIGIAMLSSPEMTADQLIRRADIAMYGAKKSGKNCIVVYNQPVPVKP